MEENVKERGRSGIEKRKKVSKYYINKKKPQYKSSIEISVLLNNRIDESPALNQ